MYRYNTERMASFLTFILFLKHLGSDLQEISELGRIRANILKLLFAALRLPGGGAMLGAAHVVTTSVGMCDVDLRYVTSRLSLMGRHALPLLSPL